MSSSKKIKSTKATSIKKNQIHKDDTGSPETQISLLNKKIESLTAHLLKNKGDFASRVGLLKSVGKRKKLLRYVATISQARYNRIIAMSKKK